MAAPDDLLDYFFGDQQPALYPELERWLRGSRRFQTFAHFYRGKIRAKLRNARDEAGQKDLRAELETAALLLRDERFVVEYEKYAASKQRGPDFTVTFKTHTPFNVEVRRMRGVELEAGDAAARLAKLVAVLGDKVGQMPPSIVNLLWLIAEQGVVEADVAQAAATLRQLAEHKTELFFTRRGFESAADFLKQYGRLSGVIVRQSGEPVLWLNPLARHKTPPEIALALRRLAASEV
ncbi:hypothetical protein [Promineifilum sp.]|uniref:hypothetical protein n=1 Tax=Promineifilum sp. TaxID=2664178 RepID=UPI0035B15A4A